jgi:hypothetical protein
VTINEALDAKSAGGVDTIRAQVADLLRDHIDTSVN